MPGFFKEAMPVVTYGNVLSLLFRTACIFRRKSEVIFFGKRMIRIYIVVFLLTFFFLGEGLLLLFPQPLGVNLRVGLVLRQGIVPKHPGAIDRQSAK